ncbi:hypothetical protein BDQ12DRAFT_262248 [Crucibulum laeve]|uniref:Uncharacterized protein n=1 Tax=Crucibulum laeve TaxID=68775 RepID=A0A5C3LV40_9AGAR|nr:hypothetical protein BDQ12DRAFT_262248 [Crucibulum laeve]
MSGFRNQTFDDRDTGNFRYQGNWFLTGSWNASNVGDSGTLSSTSDLNANVTFTFPIPATAFYYYGIPRCCGGTYGICIDCDPNNPIFLPIDAVNTTDDGKNPPVVLFSMTFKQPGIHEIILRNQNDTRFGHSQITLDRFDLEVVDLNSSSSSSSLSSVTMPSSTASAPPNTPPSSSQSTTSTSSPPIGAIVGGVIGGFVILSGLIIFWFCLRRRRRSLSEFQRNNQPFPSSTATYQSYTPYPLSAPGGGVQSANVDPEMSSATVVSPIPNSLKGYGYGAGKRGHVPQASMSASSSAPSTSTDTPPAASITRPARIPRRELDAGPVNIEEGEEDEDATLPPEYAQVFARPRSTPNRVSVPVEGNLDTSLSVSGRSGVGGKAHALGSSKSPRP